MTETEIIEKKEKVNSFSKISFVLPCYNSQNTIEKVTERIINTVKCREGLDYEIILVNDCSPDNVYEVVKKLASENEKIKGINLAKNFGQHSALMAGFSCVTGDAVVCLDDDGQTPPEEMFKLIDSLGEDCDVAFAKYTNKKHSLFRNMGSKVNDLMARWLIGKPKNLSMMSYFACKRFIIDEVVRYDNPYPYVSGLLIRSTKKVKNVEMEHSERLEGKSGYSLKKLLGLWFNGFTSFSVKPLRLASFMGVFCALIGFAYGIYLFINKLINWDSVQLGYTSTIAIILFVGGMLMMMLGLIGEYIGRIYISLNKSPQYVIKEKINVDKTDENK